jgi:hypothetical protein
MPTKKNKYLYFVIVYYFYQDYHRQLLSLKDNNLLEKLKSSLNEYDTKYGFNAKFSTSSKIAINGRLEFFCTLLDTFLLNNHIELDPQRIFSSQMKEELFKENSICKICGNTIHNISDAEVDHIIP